MSGLIQGLLLEKHRIVLVGTVFLLQSLKPHFLPMLIVSNGTVDICMNQLSLNRDTHTHTHTYRVKLNIR